MKNRKGLNDDWSNQPRGGVGEHGMSGRLGGISGEISAGGCEPNARRNPDKLGEAGAARGEVGSVHSSGEGRNETGAKGPNLIGVNSEAAGFAMAPLREIATYQTTRRFPRTRYHTTGSVSSTVRVANDLGKPDAGTERSDICQSACPV